MALDPISICNQALGECGAAPITDFEEQGTIPEWCVRLYGPTLEYLLDRHEWKFARVRRVLAQTANDRPGEWSFAYARPEGCVQELRVIPQYSGDGEPVPLLLGQIYAPWVAQLVPVSPLYHFLVVGETIYSNIEAAQLEYVSASANEQTFRPLFIRALVLELASRLVMPIKQDRQRQGDLVKAAEVALDRAIADEINRDDESSSYGEFLNSTELARSGGFPVFGWPHPVGR